MKLTELAPHWMATQDGRDGMGVSFVCPHCGTQRLAVWFANPVDGGAPAPDDHPHFDDHHHPTPALRWRREGETFETLSLTPSVDASAAGHWHGFITAGNVA